MLCHTISPVYGSFGGAASLWAAVSAVPELDSITDPWEFLVLFGKWYLLVAFLLYCCTCAEPARPVGRSGLQGLQVRGLDVNIFIPTL